MVYVTCQLYAQFQACASLLCLLECLTLSPSSRVLILHPMRSLKFQFS
jgi:hypothetical protein